MSDRLSIKKSPFGAQFIEAPNDGHGRDGQVKKASFWGREVKVQGQKMNAGSLVDFLNTQVGHEKQLKKGWFFGLGGSSNKEIKNLFNEIYSLDPLKVKEIIELNSINFSRMQPVKEDQLNRFIMCTNEDILKEFDDCDYKAVFLTKMGDFSERFQGIFLMSQPNWPEFEPRLYICLSDKHDFTTVDDLINEAIKNLAELDLPVPNIFCCNGDDFQPVRDWQIRNC